MEIKTALFLGLPGCLCFGGGDWLMIYGDTAYIGGKEILHGINAMLPDKSTTAVIGPSGSGKTTLCNLIAWFWDVDSGSVKIGGRDVKDYTLESLIEQISMVFQNVYLFADTIENKTENGAECRPDSCSGRWEYCAAGQA